MDLQSRHYCPNCRAPYDLWKSKLKSKSAKAVKINDILENPDLDVQSLQVTHACSDCTHVYTGLVIVVIDLKKRLRFRGVKQPDFGPVLEQIVDLKKLLTEGLNG